MVFSYDIFQLYTNLDTTYDDGKPDRRADVEHENARERDQVLHYSFIASADDDSSLVSFVSSLKINYFVTQNVSP